MRSLQSSAAAETRAGERAAPIVATDPGIPRPRFDNRCMVAIIPGIGCPQIVCDTGLHHSRRYR